MSFVQKEDLERVIREKIAPLVEEATQKYIGVKIGKLESDISEKLEKNPILQFPVDASLTYKNAKNLFKKQYFTKLLQVNYGNISKVAEASGLDRRSVHRFITELKINVDKIRQDMIRAQQYKKEAVDIVLRSSLESYKKIIHPEKMEAMYARVPSLSEEIAQELPFIPITWDEAERLFEKDYFARLLEENKGLEMSKLAKKIKLRYETLHRKLKSLELK